MKKLVSSVVVLSFLLFTGIVWAQRTAVRTVAKEEVKPVDLNGITWEISVRDTAKSGKRGRAQKDTLIFSNGKFISKNFESQGYPGADYSVRVGTDGSTIWESMQVKEGGVRIFWRGDIDPQNLQVRGVLCKQSARGKIQNFSFVGHAVK